MIPNVVFKQQVKSEVMVVSYHGLLILVGKLISCCMKRAPDLINIIDFSSVNNQAKLFCDTIVKVVHPIRYSHLILTFSLMHWSLIKVSCFGITGSKIAVAYS